MFRGLSFSGGWVLFTKVVAAADDLGFGFCLGMLSFSIGIGFCLSLGLNLSDGCC